jgi:hypothetical protein
MPSVNEKNDSFSFLRPHASPSAPAEVSRMRVPSELPRRHLCSPDFVPTILNRYNKYAVLPHASDDSTFGTSFLMMDAFCDSVTTSLSVAWR